MSTLSEYETKQLELLTRKKYGTTPDHLSVQQTSWDIAVWDDEDIPDIISKPKNILSIMDKIWQEISNTDRKTTIQPVTAEIKVPQFVKPRKYERTYNIITTDGLIISAQQMTGQSTKTNTHCVVGDGTGTEDISATSLTSQLKTKSLIDDGERTTVDADERYGIVFFRNDFTTDVTIREAGLVTGTESEDKLTAKVVFADKPIAAAQSLTIRINSTHQNGQQT